jgi:acyl carrier protein
MGTSNIERSALSDRVSDLLCAIANIPQTARSELEDARLDNELLMESLKFVELQVAIEDEFDIELDPIHIVELNRLGDIIDYIHDCIQAKRP